MKIINSLFILFIRCYKYCISPYLGSNCRFTPTCSTYSIECFQSLPFHKALWYSCIRILKCHPFHKGGYDPIKKQ